MELYSEKCFVRHFHRCEHMQKRIRLLLLTLLMYCTQMCCTFHNQPRELLYNIISFWHHRRICEQSYMRAVTMRSMPVVSLLFLHAHGWLVLARAWIIYVRVPACARIATCPSALDGFRQKTWPRLTIHRRPSSLSRRTGSDVDVLQMRVIKRWMIALLTPHH